MGATVAGAHGGEAIAELAARLNAGKALRDLARAVHAYPTFAEGPVRAAENHLRRRWMTERTRRITRALLWALRLGSGVRRVASGAR